MSSQATQHPFAGTLKRFRTAGGKEGRLWSLPALSEQFPRRQPPAGEPAHRARERAAQLRRREGHARSTSSSSRAGPRTPTRSEEIPFVVARVVLQDFTGVPLLADLAAMRNVAQRMGQRPRSASSRWCRSTWSSTTR